MENIEQITPEEHKKNETDSPDVKYIPNFKAASEDQYKDKKADRRLESQLHSPEEFADSLKTLVDNAWSDDYA